ncbi:sugar isomerase domain-containing protein [Oscillospiraceae bacterium PP1C4]
MKKQIMQSYFAEITGYLTKIMEEEEARIQQAAGLLAEQVAQDRLIHIWGPGGHSNMNAMEVFFRAGGLMHVNAILDEGTLLSSGAMRSMSIERNPGYGRIVVQDNRLAEGDILIIANSYGINTACLDAAFACKERGVKTIAVTSKIHAESTPADHPARHPSKINLYEACDYFIDSKVQSGDAVMDIDGIPQKMGAMSTFANAFILNSLMMETASILASRGVKVPIWRSGNAPGGDAWNQQFINRFLGKVRWL